MKRLMIRLSSILLLLSASSLLGSRAMAATSTQTVTMTATVSPSVTLSLSSNTISFGNLDQVTGTKLNATEGAVTVTARARAPFNVPVTLTVLAADDLKSSTNTISIDHVSWTAAGAGFQAGTLSKTAVQTVGSWVGPGAHTGSITYSLANNPGYATGTYTTTLTYTLTTP